MEKSEVFSLLVFVILVLIFQVEAQSETEQRILLKIKEDLENPDVLLTWKSSNELNHCNWTGVICENGFVKEISFSNFNLTAKVSSGFCALTNLTSLDLSFNYFSENFPTFLYNCLNLEYLDLSQNSFVGIIPKDIYRLSSRLQVLNLDANNFSGDIPAEIARLSSLKSLTFNQNLFNGSFPAEIGNLMELQFLEMSFNPFSPWKVPIEFRRLRKLKTLKIRNSNLIGEISDFFSNMTDMEFVDLSDNILSGKIPSSLFRLRKLKFLYLFNNNHSGEIPRPIEALNLEEMDLSANALTGTIPDDIGKLEKLTILFLYYNQLSGEIPSSIGRLPDLINIRLFHNNLTGSLPPDLGTYSKLQDLEVSINQLSGELPRNICAGGALYGLVLFQNNFTGTLPESLDRCPSLFSIQLHNNKFVGDFPVSLWMSENINSIFANDNFFTGTLPQKLGSNLTLIRIGNNKFTGDIPDGISNCKNLVEFRASNNNFFGKIPSSLTELSKLEKLFLDGNNLSGELPAKIISWRSLAVLNLSKNHISGSIPESITFLSNLNALDLSENELSGEIPKLLGHLKLSSFNLSSNKLSGQLPADFDNKIYDSSFLNNPYLCSVKALTSVHRCNLSSAIASNNYSRHYHITLILISTAFLLMFSAILCVFIIKDCRRRERGLDPSTWKVVSFQRLQFDGDSIVRGLTDRNLIGSGGSGKVYRTHLDHRAGNFVAVKRMLKYKNTRDEKLRKQFRSEIEILSRIRHSNVVNLLCCISSRDTMLIVYEYVENGNLYNWLHGENKKLENASLLWPIRLNIAIGIAQGLNYMHHDCKPAIIHRDVKSSNILLDAQFNPKVADFGLAKMMEKEGEGKTSSAIAGSFGYIAPECGYSTKVNEKNDVYSYGVILLELTTGRRASHGDENISLAEWVWRRSQNNDPVEPILDPEIKKSDNQDQMILIYKLGLICTSPSPSSRPPMKDILNFLLRINSKDGISENLMDSEIYNASFFSARSLRNSQWKSYLNDNRDDLESQMF